MVFAILAAIIGLALLTTVGLVTLTIAKQLSGAVSGGSGVTLSDNNLVLANPLLPPAQPGTLAVHTSSTAGTLVMVNLGHGISTGERLDLYWGTNSFAFGATAGTVSGVSVPFTGAAGMGIPTVNTGMVVGIPVECPFVFTAANLTALALIAPVNAQFTIIDNSTFTLNQPVLGGTFYAYNNVTDTISPVGSATATINNIYISQGSDTINTITGVQAAALAH